MIYLGCDPGSTMTAPKYVRVAEDIRSQIRAGTLKVGDRRGEGPALEKDELITYRKLAHHEDPFGFLQARSLRSQLLHSEGE